MMGTGILPLTVAIGAPLVWWLVRQRRFSARRTLEMIRLDGKLQRARDALRQSEERYALAALAANDGLWDWDLARDRCDFSLRWRTMLGLESTQILPLAREWLDRVHPDDAARLRSEIDAHFSRQLSASRERAPDTACGRELALGPRAGTRAPRAWSAGIPPCRIDDRHHRVEARRRGAPPRGDARCPHGPREPRVLPRVPRARDGSRAAPPRSDDCAPLSRRGPLQADQRQPRSSRGRSHPHEHRAASPGVCSAGGRPGATRGG